jgi:hypothetical protein
MKPLMPLRGVGPPPAREETDGLLERPPARKGRRKKSGRTEQFNSRVRAGFRERVKTLADREKETLGAFLENLVAEYEAHGASLDGNVIPAAEARAGRTDELRVWCAPSVFQAVPKLAGECTAMAVTTIHEAANAKPSMIIGRSIAMWGLLPLSAETATPDDVGSSRLSGRPRTMCAAAHTRHISRQPSSAAPQAVSGQPTVLAKPASKVMPVMDERAATP